MEVYNGLHLKVYSYYNLKFSFNNLISFKLCNVIQQNSLERNSSLAKLTKVFQEVFRQSYHNKVKIDM